MLLKSGELLRLGFDVSERTVARYLRRVQRRGGLSERWLTYLVDGAVGKRDFDDALGNARGNSPATIASR